MAKNHFCKAPDLPAERQATGQVRSRTSYSGGTAPDFNGLPYLSPINTLKIEDIGKPIQLNIKKNN